MRFVETALAAAMVVELEPLRDHRGFFARTFCAAEFADHGLPTTFPQSNLSRNDRAGTLRGMHFNTTRFAEAKLVRCTRGAIHDVIVDIRAGSPTNGRWVGVDLTADAGTALFVPAGFAHGFLTLVDDTDVEYLMSMSYVAEAARGARWDEPAWAIEWPAAPTTIAERDAGYPDFDPAVLDG